MFGFFYTVLGLGHSVCKSAKINAKNEEIKKRCTDSHVYVDYMGKLRLLSNDHLAMIETDYRTFNTVIVDLKTGATVVDLTEEKILKAPLLEGQTVRLVNKNRHVNEKITGLRYSDLKTGKIYVARSFYVISRKFYSGRNEIDFLMNMEGYLVRPVNKKYEENEDVMKYIENFNNEQSKNTKVNYYNFNDTILREALIYDV